MLSLRRLAFAFLAVAAVANAACDEDIEINGDGDVSQLDSCSTLKGSITIGKKVQTLLLPDNLGKVTGDIVCDGASSLTSFSAAGLQEITGKFELTGLTVLASLSMPMLNSVGEISWTTLPALKALDFTSQVKKAKKVLITDTILTTLEGINLVETDTFNINNNRYLKIVNVALGNVTEALTIAFNGKGVNASFPNLKWAQNITVRDAGDISFPKLESVNNSISFVNNTFKAAQFPMLTEVGQSLAFVSCTQLTNLTANDLESVGGTFQLANNTKLEEVTSFGALKSVGGAIDMSGAFKKVSLPKLDDVRGGFNLQSTEKLDCTQFDNYKSDGVIKGSLMTCKGEADVAESTNGGASTKGDGSSDKDTSGAGQVALNLGLAAFAGAAALMAF
ncbi:hypothetical protein EDC01DRAFT_202516 [Geopyxis carbonaria]|nr:hypothetical protein EDC01DRAFT_202516 [Geopyxis carbonaria]